jgi:histidinol-phosphate aminotransferase
VWFIALDKDVIEYKYEEVPEQAIRLHLNECLYPPPQFIIESVISVLRKCNQYPSKVLFDRFRELLAEYVGVDKENVYPFTGADSALRTILSFFAKPGDRVLHIEPTYYMIKVFIANMGLKPIPVQSFECGDWWCTSLEELLDKAQNADIAIIVDPNNPTGSPIIKADKGVVKALADKVSKCIVFDEVYHEFAGYTVARYVNEVDNILVVRSLSKAFCLAGFRLGYVVGAKDVIARIASIHTSFDIPTPCLAAGIVALENREFMEKVVREVIEIREILYTELRRRGYKVFKSYTNFLLIKDKRDLDQILRRHSIYIKRVGKELFRITVPPRHLVDMLLKALGEAS